MWANGQAQEYDDGTGGKQTYGVHPFAMVQSSVPGLFFGVYFRSTNAMSPILTHSGSSTSTLSYITTGGIIEIYFMFKASPKELIKTY